MMPFEIRPQLMCRSEETIHRHVCHTTIAMKFRVAAKATKGKGRRYWPRGQASSSNPLTKKHRSKAKWNRDDGEAATGGLTVGALATHNALNFESLKLSDEEQSEKNTINTFASLWSQCTNPDFEQFLNTWTASSNLQKEMLAILGTACETIKEKGGQQGTTEYFLVLMTMLEEVDSSPKVSAIVELLRIVVGKISVPVLRHGFQRFTTIIVKALNKFASTSNFLLLRGLIHCLGIMIRSIDWQCWNDRTNLKLLEILLPFAVHNDANVRKSARRSLTGVVSSARNDPQKVVASFVASYCITRMNEASVKENVEKIVRLMLLLKIVVSEIPTPSLKRTIETLLSFMTLENATLTSCALEIISLTFNSESPALTMQMSIQIFNALFEFMPRVTDPEVVSAWMKTNKDILCYWKADLSQLSLGAVRFVEATVLFFATDMEDLREKVAFNLILILKLIGDVDMDVESVNKISVTVDSSLQFKYQDSWSAALTVVAAKFEVLGSKYPAVCIESLKSVVALRTSPDFSLESETDRAVGAAVTYLGPESVMQVIGLSVTPEGIKCAWILPVLRRHILSANLSFFAKFFIPLAQQAKMMSEKKATDEISAKHLEIIHNQIWSLLPCFCLHPNDIESFSSLAPTLGRMLRDDGSVRCYILSALRNLVKFVEVETEAVEHVAKYGKNFFPILLNIYTTEYCSTPKDNLLPVYETFQSFLRIAKAEKIQELNCKTLERYSQSPDEYLKLAYLDLMRAFLPFLDEANLVTLFEQVAEPLLQEKNCRLQKKGYRLIEELCRSGSPVCKDYVQSKLQSILQALMHGLRESAPSAKSAVLNALRTVIVTFFVVLPQEIDIILGKLIPLIFRALEIRSARTRLASLELMKTLVALSLQNQMSPILMKSMEHYLTTSETADKAILCVTSVLPQLIQCTAVSTLLPMFDLIYAPTRSKVTIRAVVEFTKVSLKELPDDCTFRVFELVTKWISGLRQNQRAACRVQIKDIVSRLIKKFG